MSARFWPRAWVIWLGAFLGSFSVLEEAGFKGRYPGHITLSRVMNRWLLALGRWLSRTLGLGPDHNCRWLGAGAFAAFWIALTVHFITIDADQEAGSTPEVSP